MADNVAFTPGSGATGAADDIGGVMYPRVKISVGADGSATDLSDAAPMPIKTVGKFVDVTLSLDTAAYADGDLLADTQIVDGAFRIADGTGILTSVQVLDEDDQGQALDLVFLSANNTLGTENAAPSVSDANARDILGRVRVNSADYIDLGGCRIATITGIGLGVKAVSGTDDLYVAAISRGTGTYTASGIRLRIYVAAD